MTDLRIWNEGDPEPRPRPAVVCEDGVTALYDREDWWHRMEIVHYALPVDAPEGQRAAVTGGETCMDWETLTESYGPIREATAEETDCVLVRYVGPRETA
jgi:hypothetical protein